ncbi:MAG: fibronectin type III domain-containing protein [Phycisphaerae bacterium]|nr:fibronectin type III domain-containing protein [Phycisphaerae bacterium]
MGETESRRQGTGGRKLRQDSCQYAYQALGASSQITSQINSQANTGQFAQAGLMMRAAGGNDAVFGGIFITPGDGVEFLTRSSQGQLAVMQADNSYAAPASGAPVWLTLTYQSGVLTGYISADGTNWSQVGQTSIDLGSAPAAGLVAASSSSTTASTATFANAEVGAISNINVIPQMPQNITAQAFSGSDGRVVWRPIPNATSITVEQSTDNGSTWNTVEVIPGTADTWLPTGLSPSTTYSYRVQASNANGNSLWSPVVNLTTLATPANVGYYQVSLGADTYVAGGYDDVMYAQDSSQAIAADSWQQAMLLGASGGAENLSLGQTVIIGGFVQAAGGAGYSGNSFGFLVDSTGLAYDDTAQNYYYNQNQIDHCQDTSWLSFSVALTDASQSLNTLTQAAGATQGEFVMGVNPSTGEAAFNLDVSNLEFGGPDYPTTPDIIWSINGSTANPASGDFAATPSPTVTLSFTDNYSFQLVAGVALYSGSTTIDTTKPEAAVNIDVLHADSITSLLLTPYAFSTGPTSTDTGLTINNADVVTVPEDSGASLALTLNAAVPNTPAALAKLGWAIQRNPQDILNGPNPSSTPSQKPPQDVITPNSPGSFNIIAYADLIGNGQWQPSEILRIFHLAVVDLVVPSSGITISSTPAFTETPDMTSGTTSFSSDGPNDTKYPAITITASDYDLEGGGSNMAIGTAQITSGWIQNVTGFTDVATYSPTGYGELYLQGTLPILDYDPTAVPGPFYQAPTGGPVNFLTAVMTDAPSITFDNQDANVATPNSLISVYEQASFADYLDSECTAFPGVFASYAQTGWHITMQFALQNGTWSSAGSSLSLDGITSTLDGSGPPGVTTGTPADDLTTEVYFAAVPGIVGRLPAAWMTSTVSPAERLSLQATPWITDPFSPQTGKLGLWGAPSIDASRLAKRWDSAPFVVPKTLFPASTLMMSAEYPHQHSTVSGLREHLLDTKNLFSPLLGHGPLDIVETQTDSRGVEGRK